MKSTMSRYMDPAIADQLLGGRRRDPRRQERRGDGAVLRHPQLHDASPRSSGRRRTVSAAERVLHAHGRLHPAAKAACSTSSSATRSWPASASRCAHDDDEDRAVRAAIAMITRAAPLERERASATASSRSTSASASTPTSSCPATSARTKRMDYTIIGDGVNLAVAAGERVQAVRGAHPDQRVHVQEAARHLPHARDRSRRGQGQDQAGRGLRGARLPQRRDVPEPDGRRQPLQGRAWPSTAPANGTRRSTRSARRCALNPHDKLSQIYIERCEKLKLNPPEGEWDGVWVMEDK